MRGLRGGLLCNLARKRPTHVSKALGWARVECTQMHILLLLYALRCVRDLLFWG